MQSLGNFFSRGAVKTTVLEKILEKLKTALFYAEMSVFAILFTNVQIPNFQKNFSLEKFFFSLLPFFPSPPLNDAHVLNVWYCREAVKSVIYFYLTHFVLVKTCHCF